MVPAGTLLVKGLHWNAIPRCARGHTPETELIAQERVFRVRHLLSADLQMEDFTEADMNGLTTYSKKKKEKIMAMGPKRVTDESHAKAEAESIARSRLDFEEDDAIETALGDGEEEEDD